MHRTDNVFRKFRIERRRKKHETKKPKTKYEKKTLKAYFLKWFANTFMEMQFNKKKGRKKQ